MKFSVVIPTHNRLKLLADGLETIRSQPGTDWELVVFDNASQDPIGQHIASLKDPRIRYERSDDFLPVTDSWNRAMDLGQGDYVILLGDDDALTPNYFTRLNAIIDEFDKPEVIYTAIYQFMHPGVAPWDKGGYVADVKNGFFFEGHDKPFRLSTEQANQAVMGSLNFSRNFTFNIQAFVFSKGFLAKLRAKGPIFGSPFPDYYLANVALALADNVVVVPDPMAIAGVSTASYGFTLFNGLEEKGDSLLNAKLVNDPIYPQIENRLLPGASYITNYAVTMEHVARMTSERLHAQANFPRYRRLQVYTTLQAVDMNLPAAAKWDALRGRLSLVELLWASVVKINFTLGKRCPYLEKIFRRVTNMSHYGFQPTPRICNRGGFSTALELYRAIEAGVLR